MSHWGRDTIPTPRTNADALHGRACEPRPRERLWTLVKNGKRIDADLLFHTEYDVELQLAHEGVMASGRRWPLRQYALEEAEEAGGDSSAKAGRSRRPRRPGRDHSQWSQAKPVNACVDSLRGLARG